jgi:hypothetical protein
MLFTSTGFWSIFAFPAAEFRGDGEGGERTNPTELRFE